MNNSKNKTTKVIIVLLALACIALFVVYGVLISCSESADKEDETSVSSEQVSPEDVLSDPYAAEEADSEPGEEIADQQEEASEPDAEEIETEEQGEGAGE